MLPPQAINMPPFTHTSRTTDCDPLMDIIKTESLQSLNYSISKSILRVVDHLMENLLYPNDFVESPGAVIKELFSSSVTSLKDIQIRDKFQQEEAMLSNGTVLLLLISARKIVQTIRTMSVDPSNYHTIETNLLELRDTLNSIRTLMDGYLKFMKNSAYVGQELSLIHI